MRIVHILESLGTGGVQGIVFSLVLEQARMGHRVMVVPTERYDEDLARRQEQTLRQHGIDIVPLNRKVGSKWQLMTTLLRCRRIVAAFKPDVVNSHSTLWHLYGAVASMGRRWPHVCTIHSTGVRWTKPVRLLCSNAPVIYCSAAAYEGRIQSNTNVTCIANGVSPHIVRTDEVTDLRSECRLPADAKVVVSVGNMRPEKNYRNVIELARLLEDTNIHFFICGGLRNVPGYEDPALFRDYFPDARQVAAAGKHLHCLGPRADVSAIENGADLFLSSSLYEGLPVAVLEAYVNGLPCVLSPIEQHRQIAAVPKVWIPRDTSPEAYIEAIREALATTESHDEIYRMRKPYLEKYDIARTAREYIDFYQKCTQI